MTSPTPSTDSEVAPSIRPALTLAATTGTLLIVVNFAAGLLAGAFNIPGASGLFTGFTVPFFLVLLALTTERFGTITIAWGLYSTIAIPMYLMGPPNVFKPVFGILAALAFELPVSLFGRRRFSYFIGLFFYTLSLVLMAYVAFEVLNLPGSEQAYKYMWYIGIIFFIEGSIATVFAFRVYDRHVSASRMKDVFRHPSF